MSGASLWDRIVNGQKIIAELDQKRTLTNMETLSWSNPKENDYIRTKQVISEVPGQF